METDVNLMPSIIPYHGTQTELNIIVLHMMIELWSEFLNEPWDNLDDDKTWICPENICENDEPVCWKI